MAWLGFSSDYNQFYDEFDRQIRKRRPDANSCSKHKFSAFVKLTFTNLFFFLKKGKCEWEESRFLVQIHFLSCANSMIPMHFSSEC